QLQALERNPHVLSAGLATGQPWMDIPQLGSAGLVVTDGDEHLAPTECARLASEEWRRRRDYFPELTSIDVGVREAFGNADGLVVLSDSGDATTSGAPGDSNWVLQELLKYDWQRPGMVTLVDPELVWGARQRGIGGEITAPVGGKRDHRFSRPITLSVQVAGL